MINKGEIFTIDIGTWKVNCENYNDINALIHSYNCKQNYISLYMLYDNGNVVRGIKSFIDKIISKLQTEKEKIKQELQKFKGFWHSIMSHFHKRICFDKDENYKIVSDDLYKNGIFNDNDNEIANNIARRVTIPDENKQTKNKKKNNDTRF